MPSVDDRIVMASRAVGDEKRLFARMAEAFAGFSENTDAQVGRIIDFLEQTGQLDNTLVLHCADNTRSLPSS